MVALIKFNYGQGNWKRHEPVKFNEYYHHAKFDIGDIYSVQENPNAN